MRLRFLQTLGALGMVLWLPAAAGAAELTLAEVLESSLTHFPKVQEAQAKREASEASVVAALGAFDASLQNASTLRLGGFYDGDYSNTKLVKPFESYNAQLSTGYRISNGDFPIYDDYYYTNNGGEFNLELFFSLLRDRDIDDDRLRLWNSKLGVSKAEQEALLARLSTQRAAMVAYYEWLAAVQMLRIQEELVRIANERQDGMRTKHKLGDIAGITMTENEQYLYRRQGQLNDATRLYQNAATNLSLYWRDAAGNPKLPVVTQAPRLPQLPAGSHKPLTTADELYSQRPETKMLEADIEAQRNELLAGENSLLPRTDFTVRTAKDMGSGALSREEAEHIVGVNVSIPLQRRYGEGRVSRARANLRALEQQQRMLKDQLAQQLQLLSNDLQTAERAIDWSEKEVLLAGKMQRSENTLFSSGNSDYFLLNMREEQLASARIKNVSARLDYFRSLANAYAAEMKLEQLQIVN